MDTFDLLPALADGELEQTSAPELVAAIVRTRASGTLSIENGEGVEIRQFFRAGAMCGSAYFAGFRTLAQVLLANDWVNALEIDASLAEAQASGKRHGQVLVEKGLLTADQLKQALATQHRQNLGNLLALQRGHYEMRGWEPPPAWSKELQIDPLGPLVTALGDERASPRRQKVIDWLGSHAVRLSVDWPEISARVELDAAERRAAALLALPRKRDEFLRLSHLPTDRADGLLVGLLLAGAAEPHPLGASANADQMVPQHTPPQPYQQPAHTPQPYQQPPPSYPPPAYPQYGQPGYPAAPIPTPYTSIPPMMVPVPMVQSPYGAPVVMQPYAPPYPPYGSQPPPPVSPMAPMSPPPPLRQEPDALDLVPLDPEPRPPQPPAPPLSQPPPSLGMPLFTRPGPHAQQPQRPATSPGYRIAEPPAREAQPAPPPAPPSRPPPAPNPSFSLTPDSQPAVSRPPPAPPAPVSPPQTLPDDAAFASAEHKAIQDMPREPVVPPTRMLDENEISHSGLRRAEGGFELETSGPIDVAADAARRKRMRAQGLSNLFGRTQEAEAVSPTSQPIVPEETGSGDLDESLLSPEIKRFIADVRAKADKVGAQDAYERLGVARTVGSDAIRTAYLEAAKRYHPDHASAQGMASIQQDLRTVFTAMKEAYDLISTAQARQAYEAHLKAGNPTVKAQNKKDEAAMGLKMGEVLLKKRDFSQAIQKLRRSVELDPNGDALAALAWALMCDPATSPAGKEEAATFINKALRAPGLSARTYYVAGVLWRTKDPDSAADAFRKALELEPNHADASLELRLLEMRQGRKQQGGGVLSGLLFGKRK